MRGGVAAERSNELSDNIIEGLKSEDRIIIVSSNEGDDVILLFDAIFKIFHLLL